MSAPVTALDMALRLLRDSVLSIDAEGKIWRHTMRVHGRLKAMPARRAENVGAKGYLRLTLQMPNGKLGSIQAHRVVWTWLNGPIPDGMQINHKDCVKSNNAPSNLEVVTGSGNIRHSYANGRPAPWHKAPSWRGRPRIDTNAAIIESIREQRRQGVKLKDIATQLGASISYAHRLSREVEG